MKNKTSLTILTICLLAVIVLSSQAYAKDGSGDSGSGGSSSSSSSSNSNSSSGSGSNDSSSKSSDDSSSSDSSRSSENEQRGQEAEQRGRESENEVRGQEFEAERNGANEVKGQEFEVRNQEFELRNGTDDLFTGQGGSNFEIRGIITSSSGNTFVILGKTIIADPARVANFQQKSSIATGNEVKVEGTFDNGVFLAREIKPLSEVSDNKNSNNNRSSDGIEIEDKNFRASGLVKSVSGNKFKILDQEIVLSDEKNDVKIAENQTVQVRGIIDDNGLFEANEIEILENVEKVEINNEKVLNDDKDERNIFNIIGGIFGNLFSSIAGIFRK